MCPTNGVSFSDIEVWKRNIRNLNLECMRLFSMNNNYSKSSLQEIYHSTENYILEMEWEEMEQRSELLRTAT
jgi:hypothetical protein